MGRGARHYARKKATCPECYEEVIHVTGPIVFVRGIEKAPCRCGTCGHTWKSENRAILALAGR